MNTYAALMSAAAFVAADIPITRDNVKPGWVALGIVAGLGVALFFLMRSFIKHSKRANQPWEGEDS
ncbi:MAG: hypothetical protein WBQ48_05890 [Aeromicrobium sp.]